MRSVSDHAVFEHLPTLAVIADAGNFSRAADVLGLNRAAVSKRVAQLELAVGVPVFERSTRHIEVTPAGRVLLERFRQAHATLQVGIEDARLAMSVLKGQVSIRCASAVAVHLVGPAMLEFTQQNPGIQIELQSLADAAKGSEADIELRVTHDPPPDRSVRKLCPVHWQFYASPGYLKQAGVPRTAEDLTQHRFVVPPGYNRQGVLEHRKTRRRVSAPVQADLTSNVQDVIFELVQRGAGIGLLPSYLLAYRRADLPLVPVLPDWQLLGRPAEVLYAIHAPAKFLRASTRAVLQHLAQRVKA